jgi:hypothetical protein
MKLGISIFLILHGLIVASQAAGSLGPTIPREIPNPAFVSWWPINLGRSWLFSFLGLDRTPSAYWFGGVLWLTAGILLVAAGLGVWDFVVSAEWWRSLAITGAAISLVMLLIYFHPMTLPGTAASLAILIALLWANWPPVTLVR